MRKIVIALRHGERADRHPTNRPNLIKHDPCLTEKGLIQAQQSADRIFSLIPRNSSVHLVSSPFLRTIETASVLSKMFSTPIHVDKGFGEFLLSCDFSTSPMSSLMFDNNRPSLVQSVNCEIIENSHLPGAVFPESLSQGNRRVQSNWAQYFPTVKEDVIIVVSHLYVVSALSELWLHREFQEFDENYCKLTVAEYDGNGYNVSVLCDHSHATQ